MDEPLPEHAAPGKTLTPPARRALEEAAARREAQDAEPQDAEPQDLKAQGERAAAVPELGGVDGPEPTRFGDWERKGIAVDF
jgi:hypothetical protein